MVFFRSVKVLSVNEGFMVLQNSLYSVIYFLLRLMKNLFLVSLNSFTQKFLYMLYADLVASVFFPFYIHLITLVLSDIPFFQKYFFLVKGD